MPTLYNNYVIRTHIGLEHIWCEMHMVNEAMSQKSSLSLPPEKCNEGFEVYCVMVWKALATIGSDTKVNALRDCILYEMKSVNLYA